LLVRILPWKKGKLQTEISATDVFTSATCKPIMSFFGNITSALRNSLSPYKASPCWTCTVDQQAHQLQKKKNWALYFWKYYECPAEFSLSIQSITMLDLHSRPTSTSAQKKQNKLGPISNRTGIAKCSCAGQSVVKKLISPFIFRNVASEVRQEVELTES
jgi:hypothetical protein